MWVSWHEGVWQEWLMLPFGDVTYFFGWIYPFYFLIHPPPPLSFGKPTRLENMLTTTYQIKCYTNKRKPRYNLFFERFYLLIYLFESGGEKKHKPEGGMEGEREKIWSKLLTECRGRCGVWSLDLKTLTWAKAKSWPLNELNHPDTSQI